ncbi:uncharacterized protein BP5553_04178 [Venustampulla echinocandica]|uniref:Uncharacterized protein n=1 Tax=Venustampulla echinocandica TaxID=2656787 RepID=A0A370TWI8_9HELO|nr:uncharacterized protein BP5553_04178 [Venustampulla echinocandica]RDL39838.1 hypothetical protein BP5553_04178 [Venustampulla echinocandica]
MEQNNSNIEDQNQTQALEAPIRVNHNIPADISDEDLEVRYAEHLENHPIKTLIMVNEEENATIITSHSLGEDGDWTAHEIVLDHPHSAKEEKKEIPADATFDDLENVFSEVDTTEAEAEQQDTTHQDKPKENISKYHKKRLASLHREKVVMLRKSQEIITEQNDLAQYSTGAEVRTHDPGLHRRSMLVELKTFALGMQSTRWENKKKVLEEHIAFAATPEGAAIEELKRLQEKEKERGKNKRKRAEKAEKAKLQRKSEKHDIFSGEDSEGMGRKRFRGKDGHRVNRHDGRGRRGSGRARGGRGDGRGRGRGRRPDRNEGSEKPLVRANN